MLKVQEIRELIKLIDQSTIDEFVYENDGSKIKMKKNAGETVTTVQPMLQTAVSAAPAVQHIPAPSATPVAAVQETTQETPKAEAATEAAASNLHKITSPMVGTFYGSPSPDADAYVKPGSKVTKDSIVCIVEAMKLFNEIEAEVNGEIVEVLVKNGQLVEYGQPLFLVKPE
ncbi:acetyl-CoA carboxylase biotin carboxyl carrier protein [Bacillus sp. BRMEA1]|uniref:acetyl-CoA carboxylase biotin carboxyl carrier protein n=1 Tax=Neobacillus endophyticus TaxID=2738405 RepID=UPI00156709E8|nr:acetyl-CoA carboxylase biotin carboxyl carrier protein [Neobacillus endophyticus]NRD80709.1 acetyl-CoA carboxylase biotin carboxyl carrier protein [Neobacillus endophyticus]